jgi:hypothetical protein
VVKPWKETLDAMLFADQLLLNLCRYFRLDHLVLLLLFLLICWTGVASALSRRICAVLAPAAQHQHILPASARHYAHARATRSAPLTFLPLQHVHTPSARPCH